MGRFEDKVVVITGAGAGIGEAAARRFSDEGAKVVLADRDRANLARVAGELPAERTRTHVADVAQYADVEALIAETLAAFGRLDVLVNNAGVARVGKITDTSFAHFDLVMSVNVRGVWNGCRAALPHLIASKGCIVNTASVSGLGGDWGMSLYNASKGAIVNLTRALALDHGRDGVRVNAVCPTVTFTAMADPIHESATVMARLRERVPLGRPALPAEVAAAIAFLASDDASFITGVNLPVDGGVSASNGHPCLQE